MDRRLVAGFREKLAYGLELCGRSTVNWKEQICLKQSFLFLKSSVPFFTWVPHFWGFGQALHFILRYFMSLPRDRFAFWFVHRHTRLYITKIMWGILCYFGKCKKTLWDPRSVTACCLVTRHSRGTSKEGDCIPLFARCRKIANGLYLPGICSY